MPKISVIIPCYNLGDYLTEAVDSVSAQTLEDFEIIIVNDGSTDPETIALLDSYQPPKTTVVHTPNQGLPAARNHGIALAKGEYICCLDADDKLHARYLEKCCAVLDQDRQQRLGFVTTHTQCFGDSQTIWKSAPFSPYHLVIENIIQVASVFRRDCWAEVGGFDTELTSYEDWDFWLAIVAKGYKWALIEEPLFYYRDRPGSMFKTIENRHELRMRIIQNKLPFIKSHIVDIIGEYEHRLETDDNYFKESQAVIHCEQEKTAAAQTTIHRLQDDIVTREAKVQTAQGTIECLAERIRQLEQTATLNQSELEKAGAKIQSLQDTLTTLIHSRTYRLACLFKEARHDAKSMFLLPLRIVWFFVPERYKRPVRSLIE